MGQVGQARDCKLKFTFKKLSLIKINGVIIALELSKNIYCGHKSALRAVTKQPVSFLGRGKSGVITHTVCLRTVRYSALAHCSRTSNNDLSKLLYQSILS